MNFDVLDRTYSDWTRDASASMFSTRLTQLERVSITMHSCIPFYRPSCIKLSFEVKAVFSLTYQNNLIFMKQFNTA